MHRPSLQDHPTKDDHSRKHPTKDEREKMMTGASSHTSWNEGVPDWADKDPQELCRYIFQGVPVADHREHLSSKHYLELCLVIAKLLAENKRGDAIRSKRIYEELSDECEAAVKALDGQLTEGVCAVRGLAKRGHLLKKDPNRESYINAEGEKKWSSNGPTHWAINHLIDHLREYLQRWGTSPATMAEAADQYVREGNSALLEFLAHPKSSRTRVLPTVPVAAVQRGEGGTQARTAGLCHAPAPLMCGTNGFDNSGVGVPEDRRSERSDGSSAVDVSGVNPPVTARCNRDQWRWLTSRTKTRSEQWFFIYLEHCDRQASYGEGDDRWVVVECEKLHDEFGVPWPTETVWRESDLIEAWKEGRYISPEEAEARGIDPRARKFRVKQEALNKWTELGAKGAAYRYKAHVRERPVRTSEPPKLRTDTVDEHGNRYPWLIDRAIRILKEADHEIILDALEEAEEAIAEREGADARASLTSLRLAKETVKRQVIQVQDGVAQLQNAYEVQEISGRIGFKLGGPQGLMGEVKARAYDIDGLCNYDIRECHTSALRQVARDLEQVGVYIDISPWEQYRGKYAVADETGLPVSLIKIVEHAVKYGAVIPLSISQAEDYFEEVCGYKISIAKEVKKHEERGLIDDPDETLRTLYDIFEPMRKVVKRMAKALLDDYYHATRRGGYMHNACGISFCPSRHTEGHDREAAVMAWMLQGLEAAFIHSITILGARADDFSVVANEHDGCLSAGRIPGVAGDGVSEVVEVARHWSGFHEAELVEKDFADEDDVQELYGEKDYEEPGREDKELATETITQADADDCSDQDYNYSTPSFPIPIGEKQEVPTPSDDDEAPAHEPPDQEEREPILPKRQRGREQKKGIPSSEK